MAHMVESSLIIITESGQDTLIVNINDEKR